MHKQHKSTEMYKQRNTILVAVLAFALALSGLLALPIGLACTSSI